MASHGHPDWDLPDVPLLDPNRGPVLSPEAEEAIMSSPGLKQDDLQELAEWLRQQDIPVTADVNLVKFLHSCDYDLEKAKKCAQEFYKSRPNCPEIFSDWDANAPNMLAIFDVILLCILPRKTPKNYRVVLTSLKTSDTTNYVFLDVCKTMMMLCETIFLTEPTIDGIVLIHDTELSTLGHFWKMSYSVMRKLNHYHHNGLPLQMRERHLVHSSSIVDKALQIMRRFGINEDMNKIHAHKGNDYTSLHEFIPPDCLPSDFGGTLPSVVELHEMTVKRLRQFTDVFRWVLEHE